MQINCSNCKQVLDVPDELVGKVVQCPTCNQTFTVPTMIPKVVAVATPPVRTKSCPFCGEDVMVEAKKCKHCGETIDVALRAAEEAKKSANAHQPNVYMNAGGGGGGAVATGATKKNFPHTMHLILTLCTCGGWVIIWILHYMFRDRNVYY